MQYKSRKTEYFKHTVLSQELVNAKFQKMLNWNADFFFFFFFTSSYPKFLKKFLKTNLLKKTGLTVDRSATIKQFTY